MKIIAYTLISFFFPFILAAQAKAFKDNKIKNGTFYFRPNTDRELIIIRNGSVQKEVFAGKKDTSVWRITWTNASSYKLKFIRKDTAISQEEKSFYNVHIPLVRVLSVGNDYYIFTGDLDSIKGPGSITDTIWFKRQIKR